jgi:RNA polymerase sigma-70 factor (ECF subfamily)
MREHSDEQPMRLYANGDMGAFEELYSRYREPLYRYRRRQLPDRNIASDLYQGAWEKIIGARRRYRPDAPFRAWAFRIARSQLIDPYRRHAPADGSDPATLAAGAADPGEEMDRRRRLQRLRQGIQNLPPEQRDALLLKLEAA